MLPALKIYTKEILQLVNKNLINAAAHITGGGLIENLPREGGEYSRSYCDRPWYYSSPRETNFFIRFDFN